MKVEMNKNFQKLLTLMAEFSREKKENEKNSQEK